MIKNPKMVYKVYEQVTKHDFRDGSYAAEVLTAVVKTSEEVLDVIKLDKWSKIKYVVDDGEKVDDYLRLRTSGSLSTPVKYQVSIIESERGWGSRVDEVIEFPTKDEADAFVTQFNAVNNKPTVPDWYMYAQPPILISDE